MVEDLDDTTESIEREIRIMKLLDHPNIVKLYDIISHKDDGKTYLVLEYVARGELFDYIVANGRIKESESRRFFRQLVSAVEYCHAFLVVHRDLKPSNLLLADDGSIKITDFGLSNTMTPGKLFTTWCGSLYYSAPEIIEEKRYVGPAVDIWSMGVILYALCNGRLPWSGKNDLEKIRQIVAADVAPSEPEITDECNALVKGCLTVDPNARLTIPEIRQNEWTNRGYAEPPPCLVPTTKPVDKVNDDVMQQLVFLGMLDDDQVEEAKTKILANEKTQFVYAYHILLTRPQLLVSSSYLPKEKIRAAISHERLRQAHEAAQAAAAADGGGDGGGGDGGGGDDGGSTCNVGGDTEAAAAASAPATTATTTTTPADAATSTTTTDTTNTTNTTPSVRVRRGSHSSGSEAVSPQSSGRRSGRRGSSIAKTTISASGASINTSTTPTTTTGATTAVTTDAMKDHTEHIETRRRANTVSAGRNNRNAPPPNFASLLPSFDEDGTADASPSATHSKSTHRHRSARSASGTTAPTMPQSPSPAAAAAANPSLRYTDVLKKKLDGDTAVAAAESGGGGGGSGGSSTGGAAGGDSGIGSVPASPARVEVIRTRPRSASMGQRRLAIPPPMAAPELAPGSADTGGDSNSRRASRKNRRSQRRSGAGLAVAEATADEIEAAIAAEGGRDEDGAGGGGTSSSHHGRGGSSGGGGGAIAAEAVAAKPEPTAEMRTVRGVFKCATTSPRAPDDLMLIVERAIVAVGTLKYKRKSAFLFRCLDKKAKVRLEIEICKIDKLDGLHGIRFGRINGDTWSYKKIAEAIMEKIQL